MFLNKLERKFGKYAIYNLSLYLVVGYVIGYVLSLISPALYDLITFDPYAILHGQIWRIVTWVLTLPGSDNILFMMIMLFFYYSIGSALENTWGAFKYNAYIFSGMIFTVIGGVLLYVVLMIIYNVTGNVSFLGEFGIQQSLLSGVHPDLIGQLFGKCIGACVSTYYINMSIFLAFAVTYPDMQVMLYFIIPLKVKWLGYLYGAFIIYDALTTGWGNRVMILASLLNFLIFFLTTRNYNRINPREIHRRTEFRKKVYQAHQNATYENGARHKCAICGRTELDDPNLTFRYCSKCTGGKEYCQEHLFTHEHR